jgi:glyoxylase-like metal-dependent hydrolase (beta-lactamase superfamily II)
MNTTKVLIQGYANKLETGWVASSAVTLVQSNGKNIIVDPGCNRLALLKSLKQNNLTTGDIDYVFLTHNHTDHIVLAGIFEKAKVLNDTEIYDNDAQFAHYNIIPGTDLKIISTPGHDPFHYSLIVPTPEGIYVVAGDLFWWMDNQEQKLDKESLLNLFDPYVKDKEQLIESREQVLDIADFVIPGHGQMFKVKKG